MSLECEPNDLASKYPILGPFQIAVQDYASRLRQFVPADWTIRTFCDRYPHRFQELCMVHLSFLIDIPWNLFDSKSNWSTEFLNHSGLNNSGKIGAFKRLLSGCRSNSGQIKSDEIPQHLLDHLICLINRLDTDEACSVEGLFRKAGHALRKRQLEELILQNSFDLNTLDWSQYTLHDLASTLKSILINLPIPIFTERLMPLFLQVSRLRKYCDDSNSDLQIDPNSNSIKSSLNSCLNEKQHIQLIESKQLKALRILVQLLPPANRLLLESLIRLLSRVKQLQSKNRMSSACLGTVFGPVLLPKGILYDPVTTPKSSRLMPSDFQERCQQLSSMMAILIDTGTDIFHLPRSLAEDITANCPELSTPNQIDVDLPNPSNLHTPVTIPNSTRPPCSGTLKKHSRRIRDISMLLSPKLSHHRLPTDNHDSPPLRTGIRFATPTVTNSTRHRPWESPHSIGQSLPSPPPNTKHSMFDALTDLTSINTSCCSHWIKSSGSSSSSLSSPDFSDDPDGSNHGPTNNPIVHRTANLDQSLGGALKSDVVPCSLTRTQLTTPCTVLGSPLTKFSPIQPKRISPGRVNLNQDLNLDSKTCSKRKFGRRRRFTELRLPSSMHRHETTISTRTNTTTTNNNNNNNSNNTGHRRQFFSPCPPIPLLPFRRFGSDKRDHTITTSSINSNVSSLSPSLDDKMATMTS